MHHDKRVWERNAVHGVASVLGTTYALAGTTFRVHVRATEETMSMGIDGHEFGAWQDRCTGRVGVC